ncbi:MAG: glycosyltransferase family 4 protein [Candidatus Nealsonbacteria bacterium]|nr:glycosyltransferase family 4 protein [Candidatus Nealsonbacteria bacterium]
MKNVLFISVTKYDLEKDVHLRKKFEGLARGIKSYVLARGKMTFGKKLWGAEFYLLPRNVFFWPSAFCLSFWLCLFKRIDVIVAQSPLMEGFVGVILKKILGKELIIEMHGDWEVKKSIAFLAPFSFRNADKIRGVAQYLIDKAEKIAPDKPYFIFPTFTDLDDFLTESDIKFNNFVLLVGRNDPVKGVKYLVEAFDKIKQEFLDFKLVLAGEGLPDGKLSLIEVRERMRDCYCLIVPSLSEGLPRVILEAMALGKPVIASNVGGIPDLVKDGQTGFLFEVGNVEQLAEKLRTLLRNKNIAVEMGRRGRELVQNKFSNEKYTDNYLRMINYPQG